MFWSKKPYNQINKYNSNECGYYQSGGGPKGLCSEFLEVPG